MRLNDGSRRSGAFELRVWHPPVIQDLGGTEAAMSGLLGSTPGPVISIVFSFGYGIQKSLLSSTCGGHLSLHVYHYEIYLENTGTNQFRN